MNAGTLLFWSAVLVGSVALIAPQLKLAEPNEDVPVVAAAGVTTAAAVTTRSGAAGHELKRESDSHFYAEGQVNGARVRFLIDTGASAVVLSRADARRAGVQLGHERMTVITASGSVELTPVTLARVAVGRVALADVQALVGDDIPMSLLGQSWLSRIDAVEIRGDRMVLR
jgi:aspartyl protease family protein